MLYKENFSVSKEEVSMSVIIHVFVSKEISESVVYPRNSICHLIKSIILVLFILEDLIIFEINFGKRTWT